MNTPKKSYGVAAERRTDARWPGVLLTLCSVALLAGCASTSQRAESPADPFESVNRKIYAFNDVADRYVVRPVAQGYNAVLPRQLRKGIGNFFNHWTYPVTIVNGLLQGKFKQTASDTSRFAINTTLGIAGFSDPATPLGFKKHQEDFGLTLARYGVPQGPFIMVPLLGPYTARSGTGIFVNVQANPILQMNNSSWRSKLGVTWIVQTRAAFVGPDKVLRDSYDPYALWRDFYLQNRAYLAKSGNKTADTTSGADDDEFFEDDFADDDFADDAGGEPAADAPSGTLPAYPSQ